jgi:deoxyribodipyrimidine photo-lyase
MPSPDEFEPTPAAARARLAAVRPEAYARTRNHLAGAVTRLSPWIAHGFLTLPEVAQAVGPLAPGHKLRYELGWREFFRHVWSHRGDGILASIHVGPLQESEYSHTLPDDLRRGATGVAAIDQAVAHLYRDGWLHNHARMWLASYAVHGRKLHWRAGAEWMLAHLLDGDLASNHLSWQWVAGTASHKPYLFNADNVARWSPAEWHSAGSAIDLGYDEWERLARSPRTLPAGPGAPAGLDEPPVTTTPPAWLEAGAPSAEAVRGREVWLVHPWALGELPPAPAPDRVVVALLPQGAGGPWSERRWQFVGRRLAALTPLRWAAPATDLAAALAAATRVRGVWDPHLPPELRGAAEWQPAPALFAPVPRCCNSFSQWWRIVGDPS